MSSTDPVPPTRAGRVVVWLATTVLAAAACTSVNPTTSPSVSAISSPDTTANANPSASVAPVIASPVAVGQSRTIHLILHPGNDTQVSVGSLTGCTNTTTCQGDYGIGNDPLFDAATGEQVGTLAYVEFVLKTGDSLYHSPGNTITLTGRGQIVFSETLYDDGSGRPATGAILGGTGEFVGATGEVISRSLPGSGDFVVTITN